MERSSMSHCRMFMNAWIYVAAWAIGFTTACGAYAVGDDNAVPIIKADQPIVIDGKLNEPAWRAGVAVDVNYVMEGTGKRDASTPMIARFLWDDHYLYIGYEVFDSDLIAVEDGRVKGPPGNRRKAAQPWDPQKKTDVVEFFIHLGDGQFMWELHHNSLNHFNEVLLVLLDPDSAMRNTAFTSFGYFYLDDMVMQDDGEFTLKTAVSMMPKADGKPSTPNDRSDTDTGYRGELRLPRRWLPAEKVPLDNQQAAQGQAVEGSGLSILSVSLNGNNGPVYHHTSARRPGKGMFAEGVNLFPRYLMVERLVPDSGAGD